MKKFLSKMPVMAVLLVLALGGLGLYIGLLARPVSYGMPYTYSQTLEGTGYEEVDGQTQVMTINFKSGKQVTMFNKIGEESGSMDFWYVQNGNKVWLVSPVEESITEEEFDQFIELLKADKEEWDAVWNGEGQDLQILQINAFEISSVDGSSDQTLKCTGAIVFAAVWGVIEVALIVFAALSLTFYLKGKKQESQPAETEQQ